MAKNALQRFTQIFGFDLDNITAKQPVSKKRKNQSKESFVVPESEDGSITIEEHPSAYGGTPGMGAPIGYDAFSRVIDFEQTSDKNNAELINAYRQMAFHPICEEAVSDIIQQSIIMDSNDVPVKLELSDIDEGILSGKIKEKVYDEFQNILKLLKFKQEGNNIFRKWYVDSRLYYHIEIDNDNKKRGIINLRYIDPRKILKVKKIIKEKDAEKNAEIIKDIIEFYQYTPKPAIGGRISEKITILPDSIAFIHSGIYDDENKRIIGHLHKAIKPLNQLKMMEDSLVVYRLARAPERRIFYIDVGNLPKIKAENYLRSIMNKYRNKILYDVNTGEIKNDRQHMSMLEDFWLPRREGGRGTEVTTLQGGQGLGDMEEVEYFKKKLYRSLNVPVSRLEQENRFQFGRVSEISRDEVKFSRFIKTLRNRFSELFKQLLKTQCILKNIISTDIWNKIQINISFLWEEDAHFGEQKELELIERRIGILRDVKEYIGSFYSNKWVMKNILRMSEEEIETELNSIRTEQAYDLSHPHHINVTKGESGSRW